MYLTYADGEEEGYLRTVGHLYLPYITYKGMGGTLDETTFSDFEYEAEMMVNYYTFNRLKGEKKYPDELERCMYKLIQMAKLEADAMALGQQVTVTRDSEGNIIKETTTSATIASQSNDGVSTSYNTISAGDVFDKLCSSARGNLIESTIKKYLYGVKNSAGKVLLYRGYYPGE